jgi:putative DNA primase/helicase
LTDSLKGFGDNLNPQESRVARSFAVIAMAGELAVKWGILPWKQNSALDAAVRIFERWRATQPVSNKSKEHAQILERISDFIDSHSRLSLNSLSNFSISSASQQAISRVVHAERIAFLTHMLSR